MYWLQMMLGGVSPLPSDLNRCETFLANLFTCSSNVRPLSVENYENCENCENNKNLRHS